MKNRIDFHQFIIYKDKLCQKETKGRKVELTGNVRYCFRNADYSFLWLLACFFVSMGKIWSYYSSTWADWKLQCLLVNLEFLKAYLHVWCLGTGKNMSLQFLQQDAYLQHYKNPQVLYINFLQDQILHLLHQMFCKWNRWVLQSLLTQTVSQGQKPSCLWSREPFLLYKYPQSLSHP